MKFQYLSDLHIDMGRQPDWRTNNIIVPSADVLIMAGDIYHVSINTKNEFFDWLSQNFKRVYWLLGNHEFYNGINVDRFIRDVKHPIRDNVFMVNNTVIKEDDVDLIFSTLWTKLDPIKALQVKHGMRDFYVIKRGKNIITCKDYDELHDIHLKFVKQAVNNSLAEKKIVITHHCPTELCNHSEFKNSALSSGFVVELYDYIETSNVDYWIYGHTHRNMPETVIGKTKLITNQCCYQWIGEGDDYINNAVIDL